MKGSPRSQLIYALAYCVEALDEVINLIQSYEIHENICRD